MQTFYFTFGSGQELQGFCQPIKASDWFAAREKMFAVHGEKWAFQYTQEEWEDLKKNHKGRFWELEVELKPLICE